jgi:GAF domain-containing protein
VGSRAVHRNDLGAFGEQPTDVDLIEAFADLAFLRDSLEGAEFVLALAIEKVPSELGLVLFFDAAHREYVVVCQRGGRASLLCRRVPESSPLICPGIASGQTTIAVDPAAMAQDERWDVLGANPTSILVAPVQAGGQPLGVLEVLNPIGGGTYREADCKTVTVIAERFARFVASRGVIVDARSICRSVPPSNLASIGAQACGPARFRQS